jgi:hypothetical protein
VRLPGATFDAVSGGLSEHHQRRLAELRRAGSSGSGGGCSARSSGGACGGNAYFGPGALHDPSEALAGLSLSAAGSSKPGSALCSRDEPEAAPWAGGGARPSRLARAESDCPWQSVVAAAAAGARRGSGGSSIDADSAASGPGAPASVAASVLTCASAASSLAAGGGGDAKCGGGAGGATASSTPTWVSSRRASRCSGDEAPSSPFALFCDQEYWDEEVLVVAAGGW